VRMTATRLAAERLEQRQADRYTAQASYHHAP
jgi:hypothetical protein